MSHQVYISFSSWDISVADAVCKGLEADGISCWIASRDTAAGPSWETDILTAIEGCQIVVLIYSKRADSSLNVQREITKAVNDGKHIVPFLIEEFESGSILKYHLLPLHWMNAIKTPLSEAVRILADNIHQTLQLTPMTHDTIREPQPAGTIRSERQPRASHGELIADQQYDAFISYRRNTDAQTARLIRSELQHRGLSVFLDVDDLRPGHFDEALLKRIEEARSFILILSNGSLNRIDSPDDWMRKEIVCALNNRKTIIPIMMSGFTFPAEEDLPQEIRAIRMHHGINYSHDFFEAMMAKIVDFIGVTGKG